MKTTKDVVDGDPTIDPFELAGNHLNMSLFDLKVIISHDIVEQILKKTFLFTENGLD